MYKKNNNNKNSFSQKKNCAINSIKEIEYFLHNFNKAVKSFKIYRFFK